MKFGIVLLAALVLAPTALAGHGHGNHRKARTAAAVVTYEAAVTSTSNDVLQGMTDFANDPAVDKSTAAKISAKETQLKTLLDAVAATAASLEAALKSGDATAAKKAGSLLDQNLQAAEKLGNALVKSLQKVSQPDTSELVDHMRAQQKAMELVDHYVRS